jgi:peroxiredoxin
VGGASGRNAGILAFRPFLLVPLNEEILMIQVGDKLPAGTLSEFVEVEGNGCSLGPNNFDVAAATAGKTIALFALPGAFTPTCSAKHVPGYVEQAEAFKVAGVDEIWCVSVNDAFVMGAWGREQKTLGKVRMMADGSADFAKATGLTLDLSARGLGLRSNRYSMLVVDGVVKTLNVEGPGQFEVSDAATLLKQAQQLA